MGLPSSSQLVAAESIKNRPADPRASTSHCITHCAIAERQILPWQMNKIRVISSPSLQLLRLSYHLLRQLVNAGKGGARGGFSKISCGKFCVAVLYYL